MTRARSQPVALEYKHTRRETAERYFKCARCGARGEVAFQAVGESAWRREGFFQPDAINAAAKQSETELFKDAQRTLDLVKCPSCGRRGPGALFWASARIWVWLVVAAVYALAGGRDPYAYVLPAIAVGAFGWWEGRRLVRADGAVITKLVAGPKPEPKPEPKSGNVVRAEKPPVTAPAPELPVARAIVAPPIPPPAPRDPGAGPRFLVDRE